MLPARVFLVLFLATQSFGQPLAPRSDERAVSEPRFQPAAENQSVPLIATNGDIALAAWSDMRSGAPALYATRINRDGIALDPLGIPLGVAMGAEAMSWNGDAFVILSNDGSQRAMLFISPDGRLIDRKPITV